MTVQIHCSEGFVTRVLATGVTAVLFVILLPSLTYSLEGGLMSDLGQSFLQKAAQGHYAQVALGQLAVQKASHIQVKQYGARMIQDHQKVGEEASKLTRQGGSPLPSQLSMQHQQIQQKLSQLSGKDFDIAYISFIVRDHMRNLAELEQGAKTLTADPRVEHLTAGTLPLLKDHLEQARAVAATVGVKDNDVSEAKE